MSSISSHFDKTYYFRTLPMLYWFLTFLAQYYLVICPIFTSERESICRSVMSNSFFITPWTIACQAPLSVGFSRQEYWSG